LDGFEESHCFFYAAIFMLVVENMESISRLRVVVFDVTHVPFVVRVLQTC